jgi:hypothetical protein
VPGSGCDHRDRHLRSWPERVRGEWVESIRRRVVGGFGLHARGVADVRAHESTRVVPDAINLADTQAFRGRSAFRHRHGFRASDEFPPCDEFVGEHEFWDAQFHGSQHPRR